MPFGPYADFDDCVARNGDKQNPEAYCAVLEERLKPEANRGGTVARVKLQIVPVVEEPESGSEMVAGGPVASIAPVDGMLLEQGDSPIPEGIAAVNALPGDLILVCGRLEAEREAIAEALSAGGLREHRLILREDESEDVGAYKIRMAEDLLQTYDIAIAVEYDGEVRQAYEDLGIPTTTPDDLADYQAEVEAEQAEEAAEAEAGNRDKEEMDADPGDPISQPEASVLPADGPEEFHSLMVVEGVWTGDGRYIEEGALSWRDLPLPLMATDRTTEGHMDAVLIGNITRIERQGREIHGWGQFVESADADVQRLQALIRDGNLRGISVDLDAVEYEVLMPAMVEEPEGMEEPEPEEAGYIVFDGEDMKMRVTAARIMGATVVPFPAFQEAFIESVAGLTASLARCPQISGYIQTFASLDDIDFRPPQGAREEAQRGLDWRSEFGRGGTEVGIARARDISNGRSLSPDTIGRMVSYFARHEVDKNGQGWAPGEDGYPSNGRIAWALWGGDPGRAWAEKVQRQMESRRERGSIVASGHPIQPPVVPPVEWFANPALQDATPITVDDEGRVFGHLALWGSCHRAYERTCVQPPASATNYAHFLTGEIICGDGSRLPVGQITLGAGHASHSASAEQAAAHYDNVASAVADVTAGEDEWGIWVAGALRPGLDPATVRALMASDVSGDWRRIGGSLELVAVLAVNVPGFAKVRIREMEGLVASLSLPAFRSEADPSREFMERAVERIAQTIGRSRQERLAEQIRRVNGPRVEALRSRIGRR